MKILVTGSNGFLGSWICRTLAQTSEVGAVVRSGADTYRLAGIDNLSVFETDYSSISYAIRVFNPDAIVINDWWGVENQYRNDARQLENVSRLCATAEQARNCAVPIVIGVGSQAELGSIEGQILESIPDNPTHKYGQAKSKTRHELEKLFRKSNSRFVWGRIFSTYGPLDSGSWLIPQIVDSLSSNLPIKLTKGEQIWSYLHAYDAARAFATIIENEEINGVVNIGNPNTVTIAEVATRIGISLGKKHLLEFGAIPYREDQVMSLRPQCEKLTQVGWRPLVDLEDGLAQTISWLEGSKELNLNLNSGALLELRIPART